MFAKMKAAMFAVWLTAAFVMGGCAAAGIIKYVGDKGCVPAAAHTAPVSEEACNEN